ncbi:MAG: hypothetical protein JOZ72_11670 [Alphaproteobacteria bacterium]|nr:hypothetical protein [Alphaproteobacteria bacterium]
MRRTLALLFLLGACGSAVAASPQRPPVAFFNHSFAVLDAQTADAIEHSDYLPKFGVFAVRTTTVDGGETWRGRYLSGKQTYLEFFGPDDLKGPGSGPGATGLAISPDKAGGVVAITRSLVRQGIAHPDAARRTRQYGADKIPWFDYVSTPDDPKSFSIWAMEYVPSYFEDSRTAKEPAAYPGDISRERNQSDDYAQKLMRDVTLVEIACPVEDLKQALAMFTAGGLSIRKAEDRVEASDGSTTIILDAVPLDQAGLRRIVFDLNAPATEAHVERIGRSSLVVGPGEHAVWTFPVIAAPTLGR